MEASLPSRFGLKLQRTGLWLWTRRVPIAILVAGVADWLWVTWYQSPQKQLERLVETFNERGLTPNTQDATKLCDEAVAALQEELRPLGQNYPSSWDLRRVTCEVRCSIEWMEGVSAYQHEPTRRTAYVEVAVTAIVEPVFPDAAPRFWPAHFDWNLVSMRWDTSRHVGDAPSTYQRGDYAKDSPETLLGDKSAQTKLALGLGFRIEEGLLAASKKSD